MESVPFSDYYAILGVPYFTATQEEIKAAYLNQIQYFRPDTFQGSESVAQMKTVQLNEAYCILGVPERRREYDASLRIHFTELQHQESKPSPPDPDISTSSIGQDAVYHYVYKKPHFAEKEGQKPPVFHARNSTVIDVDCRKRKFKKPNWIVSSVLLAAALVTAIVLLEKPNSERTDVDSDPNLITAEESAPAKSSDSVNLYITPQTGTIIEGATKERVAPLKVEAPEGEDYFIKLKDPGLDNATVLSFYVVGGTSPEIKVPLGTYNVYYASGNGWKGEMKCFGTHTYYGKADDLFDFYQDSESVKGWTLKLTPQENGNLQTSSVSKKDFQK